MKKQQQLKEPVILEKKELKNLLLKETILDRIKSDMAEFVLNNCGDESTNSRLTTKSYLKTIETMEKLNA